MSAQQGGGGGANRRRRARGKRTGAQGDAPASKPDTTVTTGQQQQPAQAQPAKQSQAKRQRPKKAKGQQQPAQQGGQPAQAQAKPAQAKGGKQQGGQQKKGPKKDTAGAAPQQKRSGKRSQPQKAKKVAAREKVSDSKQRRTKKPKNKQRLNLIIQSKYLNPSRANPTQLEANICEYLVNLEATQKDFKGELRSLGIVAAKEVHVPTGKNAITVFIPFNQHTKWQAVQDRVARLLEKKFDGKDILFIAQRKVMKLNQIKNNYPRPRNQTITAVHESILDDIVYPTKIVGKRTRFRVGGKRLLKVYLDPKDSKDIEPKLATYESVYKKLTKKNVKFMFPRYVI